MDSRSCRVLTLKSWIKTQLSSSTTHYNFQFDFVKEKNHNSEKNKVKCCKKSQKLRSIAMDNDSTEEFNDSNCELSKNEVIKLLFNQDTAIDLIAPKKFKSPIWERFRLVYYKGKFVYDEFEIWIQTTNRETEHRTTLAFKVSDPWIALVRRAKLHSLLRVTSLLRMSSAFCSVFCSIFFSVHSLSLTHSLF